MPKLSKTAWKLRLVFV